jgi:hypothetical protein
MTFTVTVYAVVGGKRLVVGSPIFVRNNKLLVYEIGVFQRHKNCHRKKNKLSNSHGEKSTNWRY